MKKVFLFLVVSFVLVFGFSTVFAGPEESIFCTTDQDCIDEYGIGWSCEGNTCVEEGDSNGDSNGGATPVDPDCSYAPSPFCGGGEAYCRDSYVFPCDLDISPGESKDLVGITLTEYHILNSECIRSYEYGRDYWNDCPQAVDNCPWGAITEYYLGPHAEPSVIHCNPEPGPDPPSTPTGLSAEGISSSEIYVDWNQVSTADSYDVRIFRSGYPDVLDEATVTITSHTFSGLDTNIWHGRDYYIQVRARNEAGVSNWASEGANVFGCDSDFDCPFNFRCGAENVCVRDIDYSGACAMSCGSPTGASSDYYLRCSNPICYVYGGSIAYDPVFKPRTVNSWMMDSGGNLITSSPNTAANAFCDAVTGGEKPHATSHTVSVYLWDYSAFTTFGGGTWYAAYIDESDYYYNNNFVMIRCEAQPVCGSEHGSDYLPSDTGWSSSDFCNIGFVSGEDPSFPDAGDSVSWSCASGSTSNSLSVSCSASRFECTSASDCSHLDSVDYCSGGNVVYDRGVCSDNECTTNQQVREVCEFGCEDGVCMEPPTTGCSINSLSVTNAPAVGDGVDIEANVEWVNEAEHQLTWAFSFDSKISGSCSSTTSSAGNPSHLLECNADAVDDGLSTITLTGQFNDGDSSTDCSASVDVNIGGGPVNGVCGGRDGVYGFEVEDWPSFSSWCDVGSESGFDPDHFDPMMGNDDFLEPGESVTWSCQGQNGGSPDSCSAERLDGDSCTLDGVTLAHGDSAVFYNAELVPFGSSCESQVLTCVDGNLNPGEFVYSSCEVADPASCGNRSDTFSYDTSDWPQFSTWCTDSSASNFDPDHFDPMMGNDDFLEPGESVTWSCVDEFDNSVNCSASVNPTPGLDSLFIDGPVEVTVGSSESYDYGFSFTGVSVNHVMSRSRPSGSTSEIRSSSHEWDSSLTSNSYSGSFTLEFNEIGTWELILSVSGNPDAQTSLEVVVACASGDPCCDNEDNYHSSDMICAAELGCDDGNPQGCALEGTVTYCSGTSAACSGTTEDVVWNADAGSVCMNDDLGSLFEEGAVRTREEIESFVMEELTSSSVISDINEGVAAADFSGPYCSSSRERSVDFYACDGDGGVDETVYHTALFDTSLNVSGATNPLDYFCNPPGSDVATNVEDDYVKQAGIDLSVGSYWCYNQFEPSSSSLMSSYTSSVYDSDEWCVSKFLLFRPDDSGSAATCPFSILGENNIYHSSYEYVSIYG